MALFENIEGDYDRTPIVLIDKSGSTAYQMNDDTDVLEQEISLVKTILAKRRINELFLMYWDHLMHIPCVNLIKLDNINNYDIGNTRGATYLGQALESIPDIWFNNTINDIYIFTDGEIFDNAKKISKIISKIIKTKNVSIFIITVEPSKVDYHDINCAAGNSLYAIIKNNNLTKHVKKFTCYNNFHTDGFINFNNPDVPDRYAPFRDSCFKINKFSQFIQYLDNLIVNESNIIKLSHDLSITIYYLTKNKPLHLQKDIIAMILQLFVKSPLYNDIWELLLVEINNHGLGKATTFQEYKQNRGKLFGRTELSLNLNVKKHITNGYNENYVSFIMNTTDGDAIIKCPNKLMIDPVKSSVKVYNYGGIKLGDHTIPLLPSNIIMSKQSDQCLRQWIRANYSKKYSVNGAADIILYYFLADALRVFLSDIDNEIILAYVGLTRVMLNRNRFGTGKSETTYLSNGNPPAPVIKTIEPAETMINILKKCVTHLGGTNIEPYTLWYGIMVMMSNVDLMTAQFPFCKDDIEKNIGEIYIPSIQVIAYLKQHIPLISTYNIPDVLNCNYLCYITLDDTSKTGGYMIKKHQLSKNVICAPTYVVSEEGYKSLTQKGNIICPLCYVNITFKHVSPQLEQKSADIKSRDTIISIINERIYNHTYHDNVKMIHNDNNINLYTIDNINFDTTSYTICSPVLRDAMNSKMVQIKTKIEFNNIVYDKYPFLKGLNMDHICLAGGFVRSILLLESKTKDFDFFFYGSNSYKKFRQFLKNILTNIKKIHPNIKFMTIFKPLFNVYEVVCVYDPSNLLTNNYNLSNIYSQVTADKIENNVDDTWMSYRLQFILTTNESINTLLSSFDLYPSQVAYDGEDIYFTKKSHQAYKYMINIVNEDNYSSTFNYRLLKYFTYGFDIVVPELDMDMIKNKILEDPLDAEMTIDSLNFNVTNIVEQTIVIDNDVQHQLDKIAHDISEESINMTYMYISSETSSIISLLQYIESNNINYLFTDSHLIPDKDGLIHLTKGLEKIKFVKTIDHTIDHNWYGNWRCV